MADDRHQPRESASQPDVFEEAADDRSHFVHVKPAECAVGESCFVVPGEFEPGGDASPAKLRRHGCKVRRESGKGDAGHERNRRDRSTDRREQTASNQ